MDIKDGSVLYNRRVASTSDSTLGILHIDGKPEGFVIEDEHRLVKVSGETRIPEGEYELVLRKQLTPLTRKYRAKYDWFYWHIELKDVRGFSGIYIHIGNKEAHTDGCQVVGNISIIEEGEYENRQSTIFFKELYLQVCNVLESGGKLTYKIENHDL